VGPVPALDYYMPENMMPKERNLIFRINCWPISESEGRLTFKRLFEA